MSDAAADIVQWKLLVLALPLIFGAVVVSVSAHCIAVRRLGRPLPWWPTLAAACAAALGSYVLAYRWLFVVALLPWPRWTGLA